MDTKNHRTELDAVVSLLIALPAGTKEYYKCLEKIRWIETGGHTLGLNSSWEPVASNKDIVDINISKAL